MGRPLRCLEERIKRFWSYVRKTPEGHWLWFGKVDKDGYGSAWWNGKQQRAHRVAWEIVKGETLPYGIDLHHQKTCPRNCIRPEHLNELEHSKHASIHTLGRKRHGTNNRKIERVL